MKKKSKSEGYRVSYAQNREDIILSGFFEGLQKGCYVDVGANDPNIDSVTKFFYEKGWSGINIEPQLKHYKALTAERPRDITLNIGISEKAGSLKLRQYKGDGLSTFSGDMMQENSLTQSENTDQYEDIIVEVRTLKSVFIECNVSSIQFMKVDVEGYEYEVLSSNDWKKYRPEVICIEANHVKRDWHEIMELNHYKLAFFDGLNEYFIDKKLKKARSPFSYVDSVVLGTPIISSTAARLIDDQEYRVNYLLERENEYKNVITSQNQEIESISAHAQHLQNELNEIVSLKSHIKKYTKKKLSTVNSKIENRLQPKKSFTPEVGEVDVQDILTHAHDIDVTNQKKFYSVNSANKPLRVYRTSKKIAKSVIKGE
ncbi:TPA: FkbM family methyltransferase [Candidatus Saccharibacteria bacterium]|nr:MAG: FkbM family methyltransferase [Candidatus Saccharibacteria bacterium GW2011_GWC2_44_17]OGL33657.1 MAG: hypothetical protein A3E20_02800 [Candidatus Saccharibacteria bacterium RIFCSPHIGHO2_12_FULL_47_16]HBH77197.1 FkbM family methyltransferase [Candidatus Saccharibacteria bacterium]